ncbi:MAG: hypothetical protein ACK5N0_04970 [Synechococcaceae cyanobacterium]
MGEPQGVAELLPPAQAHGAEAEHRPGAAVPRVVDPKRGGGGWRRWPQRYCCPGLLSRW